MYCKYGQVESDSRGNYMRCPKNCGCEVVDANPGVNPRGHMR